MSTVLDILILASILVLAVLAVRSTWPKEKRFLPTVIFRTFLSYHTPVPVSFLDTPWVMSTSTTPTTPLSRPTAVETSY